MKSIFISHVFEDNKYVENMKKWSNNGQLNDYVLTFETEDKRIDGEKAIKEYLKKKIEGAAIVLVLIGNDTHNHDWIKVEVELANNFNKKICCVRIPNTTGGKPDILNKFEELKFDPSYILKKLN
jgi:hypothetical protein